MIICSHRNARRVILTATCVTLMATRRQLPEPFWKCLFYVRDLSQDFMLTTYLACQIREGDLHIQDEQLDNAIVDKHQDSRCK
jgi:hypothetical protein